MSRKLFAALVVLVVLVVLLCASPAQAVTFMNEDQAQEGQIDAILDALDSWSDFEFLESQIGWVEEKDYTYYVIPAHYGLHIRFDEDCGGGWASPGGIITINPNYISLESFMHAMLHEISHQLFYVMEDYGWDDEWYEIVPEPEEYFWYTWPQEHFAECARLSLWNPQIQDPSTIRTLRTEIDPAGTLSFINSFVDAVTPEITVTQPVGSVYQQNHNIYVEFDLGDYTPATGQWCFWVRQLPDTWYYMGSRSANGADHYQQTITLNIPVGTQYQAIVGYRPHADVGDFIAWGTSPGLFGVNP